MELKINKQTAKDALWLNEAKQSIPYNRTTPFERKSEIALAKITKEAISINEKLSAFKDDLRLQAAELYEAFIAENGGKAPGKGKGGATFFNFDRSIKVELSVNERIEFDENLITLAQDKLNELLNDGLNEAKEFVKPLVMDAFTTSKGSLDTKRVLGLRRYSERIKDSRYAEAMAFIDKAIRRPDSKEYYRVWVLDAEGKYQDVQLNFSAI
jgi:hypothetical protein